MQNVLLVLAVLAFATGVYFAFRFLLSKAKTVAAETAHDVVSGYYPHPLVGNTVAYTFAPHAPIGEVVHIDGSGRARIRRYTKAGYVRRSLDRLVIWNVPEFNGTALPPYIPLYREARSSHITNH